MLKLLHALTLLILLISLQRCVAIKGGNSGNITNLKYLLQLHNKNTNNYFCAANLLAPRFALTVFYSCVIGKKATDIYVVGGTAFLKQGGIRRDVESIITRLEPPTNIVEYDIAVLKLVSPLTGANIAPIALCQAKVPAGQTVRVAAWGLTHENNNSYSKRVQRMSKRVIAHTKCNELAKAERFWPPNRGICTGTATAADYCKGDSGAGAIYQGRLCGLATDVTGCYWKDRNSIYLNVVPFRNMIANMME